MPPTSGFLLAGIDRDRIGVHRPSVIYPGRGAGQGEDSPFFPGLEWTDALGASPAHRLANPAGRGAPRLDTLQWSGQDRCRTSGQLSSGFTNQCEIMGW